MTTTSELCYESLSRLEHSRTIAFLSVSPAEGTTTAVVATAEALSLHLAARVLLIDGNFYHPSLHDRLRTSNAKGFSDWVQAPEMPLSEVVHTREGAADVLPFGGGSPRTAKGALRNNFGQLIEKLQPSYDHVLFDFGAIRHSPYLSQIVSLFDGVVVVIACRITRWETAQKEKEKLEAANANILGVVMNRRRLYIPQWLYDTI